MKLAIYGSSGTGQEVYEIASDLNEGCQRWDEVVFVDDTKPSGMLRQCRRVPFEELAADGEAYEFIIAVGEPQSRRLLRERVTSAGYPLVTIVHPDARISPSATLGSGVFVKMGAIVYANASIGDNTFIQAYSIVGHDSTIGQDCQISSFCHICGGCFVGDGVFFGAQAGIREGVSINDASVIAMGAMVLSDVPPAALAMGNPAKLVKRKDGSKVFS